MKDRADLTAQIDRLGLDEELDALVRDGLGRLSASEQASITADLQAAIGALKPALDRLHQGDANVGGIIQIGSRVVVKGELSASEHIRIDGVLEGKVELRDHVLTVGPSGRVKAQVFAKAVIVFGDVLGNVTATESVDIRDGGSVDGDIVSPRVRISEGAHFRGSVDMQRKGSLRSAEAQSATASATPSYRGHWESLTGEKTAS